MKEITKECEVCLKYRKKQIIVVVGFSLATEFNECVAMDLKQKKATNDTSTCGRKHTI